MGMKILKVKYHLAAYVRLLLYKMIFGKHFSVGKRTTFRRFFNVYLEKGASISIGKKCFFNHGCSINALKEVTIGDECIFGENVKIYDHNHRFSEKDLSIKEQGFSIGEVCIGNRCWFGSNVVVLKDVHIGDNCIIGAGSIISCDIPRDSIVTMDRVLSIKEIVER